MLTWGFPCQDISIAGKQAGIKIGETRSGLYYEGYRILEAKRPSYSIIENVRNLTSKKFKNAFKQILADIEALGYNNYWKILNARDYGVPQNRERVFIVSIRKDVDDGTFSFPEPRPSEIRLKDILEETVPEKYYISEKAIQGLIRAMDCEHKPTLMDEETPYFPTLDTKVGDQTQRSPYIVPKRIAGIYDLDGRKHQAGSVWDKEHIAPTIDTAQGGNRQPLIQEHKVYVKNATKQGYDIAEPGDSIVTAFPNSTTKRGRVGKGVSQTLTTSPNMATLDNYRIRKLTPRECWRLMGFDDTDIDKAIVAEITVWQTLLNETPDEELDYYFEDSAPSNYGMPLVKGKISNPVENTVIYRTITRKTVKQWIKEEQSRIFLIKLECDQIEIALKSLKEEHRFIIQCKYFEKWSWRTTERSFNDKFRNSTNSYVGDEALRKIKREAINIMYTVLAH